MDHWLDDMARAMAGGVSRRKAIGRLAALFGGAALATIPALQTVADDDGDHGDHNDHRCDDFCKQLPDDQRDFARIRRRVERDPAMTAGQRAATTASATAPAAPAGKTVSTTSA